jgi:hypothetical protein
MKDLAALGRLCALQFSTPALGTIQQIILGAEGPENDFVAYGYNGLQFGRWVRIAGVETFTPGDEAEWRAGRFE